MKFVRKTSYDIRNDYAKNLLVDRGILTEGDFLNGADWYFHPVEDNLCNPRDLDHIDDAVKLFLHHLNKGSKIRIYVDCDVDGFTSAALLINYMEEFILPESQNVEVSYHIPEGKEHGLETVMDELVNGPNICDLIIMPDSSSNDYEYHSILKAKGYDIIVLDHHEAEKYSEDAIVVNNQLSKNYDNKMASGVGIVYKFLQLVDEYLGIHACIKFMDLVALGEISDMMWMQTKENRFICDYGLSHINNEFFKTVVKKQCYSMLGIYEQDWTDIYYTDGSITQVKVAFYVTPLINALIRVGSQHEKEIMFESFIHGKNMIASTKRGASGTQETIAEQSTRNCVNARSRQNREKDKAIELLDIQIMNNCLDENKILILDADDIDAPTTLTGLIAMGIAAKYKKPTMLGRMTPGGFMKGSIRGREESELKDFKGLLNESGYMDFVEGHANAAGFSIKKNNVEKLIQFANNKLNDINFNENFYEADFVVPANYSDIYNLVYEIGSFAKYWGQGNKEPVIIIKDLTVSKSAIKVMGAKGDTMKIVFNNMTYLFFKAADAIEEFHNTEGDTIKLNIAGRASLNSFRGNVTPQIIVDQYEIKPVSLYDF